LIRLSGQPFREYLIVLVEDLLQCSFVSNYSICKNIKADQHFCQSAIYKFIIILIMPKYQ